MNKKFLENFVMKNGMIKFWVHLHSWSHKGTTTNGFALFYYNNTSYQVPPPKSTYVQERLLPIDYVIEAPLPRALRQTILGESKKGLYDIIGGYQHV